MDGPQKVKIEHHMTQQPHCWEYIQRKQKQYFKEILAPLVHRSIIHITQDVETTQVSICG